MTRSAPWVLAQAGIVALFAVRCCLGQADSPVKFPFSRESDLFNQGQAIEYFEKKYYNPENKWSLNDEHLQEATMLGNVALAESSLALAAAQVLYLYAWFRRSGEIIRENIIAAAVLFERSIEEGGCNNTLTSEAWIESACDIRFGQSALLFNWLAESEKTPEQRKLYYDRSYVIFEYLKSVPRYAGVASTWTSPLQINFNQLRFPTVPSRPFWEASEVPLAQFLEQHYSVFREELEAILNYPDGDLYEELRKADGSIESLATPGGWDAVRIVRYGHWFDGFCAVAPRTCALLRTRPELVNCPYVNTNYYKLNPDSHLKPHFGNAPRLTAHLPVIAPEPLRSAITVATESRFWVEGRSLVLDDTFPHAVSHWGRKPRYVLSTWFCHPCDENTDHKQTCPTK